MKTLRFIGVALLTVLMSVSFSACGGSDDDDSVPGGSSESGGITPDKLLVKETIQRENENITYEYSYDSQGRIIRKDKKENGNSGGYYVYTYIDNLIVQKHFYAYGGESMETKYTLENGLIVSEEVNGTIKNKYTYENSYLATRNQTVGRYKYIWNNGNLTSIKWQSEWQPDENATSKGGKNYEYTSYAAPQGFVFDYVEEDLGKFFGKSSKNLPSKFTEVNNDGEISEQITYDWTLKEGLPIKLVVMEKDGGGIYTTTHTYEWQ